MAWTKCGSRTAIFDILLRYFFYVTSYNDSDDSEYKVAFIYKIL